MMWQSEETTAQTLVKDRTGMMCVSDSPISRVSGTVEYNFLSGLRRLTVDTGESSLNSGWTAYNTHLSVLELEERTLTALERWQERHIWRSLKGYKRWPEARLMRSLLAEVVASMTTSVPWKRLFR